jgi:hypothetical protein
MGSLRRFDLKRIIDDYKTINLFETGTFWGDGVEFALGYAFVKINSVEIVPEIANKARSKFLNQDKVEIITSDSVSALQQQLPCLKANTLFWLDAHFPGADAELSDYANGDEAYRLPLDKELEVILKLRKGFNDVLIIDDLRIYEDGPFVNGPVPQNAMPKGERNIDFVFRYFGNTHFIFRSYLDEGYILLFPKKQYNRVHFLWKDIFKTKPVIEDHYMIN